MVIAVTDDKTGNVFPHFGRTEQFRIYDVEDGKVKNVRTVGNNGLGHGALISILAENHVDTLICGGIGGGAQAMLAESGIKLYGGVTGSADKAVEDLLAGRLAYDPDVHCDHHGEHHEGGCGHEAGGCSHGCHA